MITFSYLGITTKHLFVSVTMVATGAWRFYRLSNFIKTLCTGSWAYNFICQAY